MKIFVIGANGMAGHMIVNYLRSLPNTDVYASIRGQSNHPKIFQLDLTNEKLTFEVLQQIRPDIVINAVGILNDDTIKRLKEAIFINSLFPHILASYGDELGFKLIHISTDCVFSGLKGKHKEDHPTDGTTVYAKTKSLGEVIDKRHVTIRTSIIGPELRKHGIGLFQWFMKQTGKIKGYQHVFWNGVTTLELSKAIAWIIPHNIGGLVHLVGDSEISKCYLLNLLKDEFNKKDVQIVPSTSEKSDKTLINTRRDFTYKVPPYPTMIQELKQWMKENQKMYSHYINDGEE
ncbi:dTDP-4-dehydrorhamnose reductase family protein [Peribacillus butanolivorans]|uniref:dTDP-4-dehydrorhamnose reductase family protein n=1 Tax=Peribacillus butanolivorans TaxID=421767 RepID=UPI0037F136C1